MTESNTQMICGRRSHCAEQRIWSINMQVLAGIVNGRLNSIRTVAAIGFVLFTGVAASATTHPDFETTRKMGTEDRLVLASDSEYVCTPSGYGRKATCTLRT